MWTFAAKDFAVPEVVLLFSKFRSSRNLELVRGHQSFGHHARLRPRRTSRFLRLSYFNSRFRFLPEPRTRSRPSKLWSPCKLLPRRTSRFLRWSYFNSRFRSFRNLELVRGHQASLTMQGFGREELRGS